MADRNFSEYAESGELAAMNLGGTAIENKVVTKAESLNPTGPYVLGQEYNKNDAVRDGYWTMVANKTTTDRPAPQPVDVASYLYQGSAMTLKSVADSGALAYGARYISSTPFWLEGYRVKTVAGNHYEIVLVVDSTGTRETHFVNAFIAEHSSWQEFGLLPRVIPANMSYDIMVLVTQPKNTADVTTFQGTYAYKLSNIHPVNGEVNHTMDYANLLVSYRDNYSADRSAELATLKVGDEISAGSTRWAIQSILDSSAGGFYTFGVAPAIGKPSGTYDFTFHVGTNSALSYDSEVDYYATNPNVQGLFIADGHWESAAANNNAYGIDIIVQNVSASPDWDVIAVSGSAAVAQIFPFPFSYHYQKETDFLTTSSVAQMVCELNTPSLPEGLYEFAMSWTWTSDTSKASVIFEYQTTNADTIGPWAIMKQEAKDPSDQIARYYAFPKYLSEGVKGLKFRARVEIEATELRIDFCDLIIKRVG